MGATRKLLNSAIAEKNALLRAMLLGSGKLSPLTSAAATDQIGWCRDRLSEAFIPARTAIPRDVRFMPILDSGAPPVPRSFSRAGRATP